MKQKNTLKEERENAEEWANDVAADQTADNVYRELFDACGHQFTRCTCEVGHFIPSALVPRGCISILF